MLRRLFQFELPKSIKQAKKLSPETYLLTGDTERPPVRVSQIWNYA